MRLASDSARHLRGTRRLQAALFLLGVTLIAASALGRIGTQEAVDHLLRAALDAKLATTRRIAAIGAVGRMASLPRRANKVLRELTDDPSSWVRSEACEALGGLGKRRRS